MSSLIRNRVATPFPDRLTTLTPLTSPRRRQEQMDEPRTPTPTARRSKETGLTSPYFGKGDAKSVRKRKSAEYDVEEVPANRRKKPKTDKKLKSPRKLILNNSSRAEHEKLGTTPTLYGRVDRLETMNQARCSCLSTQGANCTHPIHIAQKESRWVDVLVGPEEKEYRLPVSTLAAECTWFAERLGDLGASGTENLDPNSSAAPKQHANVEYRPYDAQTMGGVDCSMIPTLRVSFVQPEVFNVLMRGIFNAPRSLLQKTDSLYPILDSEVWTLAEIFDVYTAALLLGCANMQDASVSRFISTYITYTSCGPECPQKGRCPDKSFCQDPLKIRMIMDVLDRTPVQADDKCRLYILDTLLFHSTAVIETYLTGTRNDTQCPIWRAFLLALAAMSKNGAIFRKIKARLRAGKCAYHIHAAVGRGSCPLDIDPALLHMLRVRAALQPLVEHGIGVQDEVEILVRNVRVGKVTRNQAEKMEELSGELQKVRTALTEVDMFAKGTGNAEASLNLEGKKWLQDAVKTVCTKLADVPERTGLGEVNGSGK